MMESFLYASLFKPIKSWKMEQTMAGTIYCSVDENGVIQGSGNFREMEIMTFCD